MGLSRQTLFFPFSWNNDALVCNQMEIFNLYVDTTNMARVVVDEQG